MSGARGTADFLVGCQKSGEKVENGAKKKQYQAGMSASTMKTQAQFQNDDFEICLCLINSGSVSST